MSKPYGQISLAQYKYLLNPLKSTRVAKRDGFSYLEAWDVKAHLTRIFGFGGWDNETVREQFMGAYPYTRQGRNNGPDEAMVCVTWQATVRLTVRNEMGETVTVQQEGAVGSATGKANSSGIGDLHDNALKQAASDALKRCAIGLGTQFGLSLYNDGQTTDVIRVTLVGPEGFDAKDEQDPKVQEQLNESLGGVPVVSGGDDTTEEEPGDLGVNQGEEGGAR